MRSSTEEGFELCPSDACQTGSGAGHCPVDGASKFAPSPLRGDDPTIRRYLAFARGQGVDIAGIEFVEAADGKRYTYDVNGTTNYSGVLGAQIGIDGMREVARRLRDFVARSRSEAAA